MAGEMDLQAMLARMRPKLRDGEYVFCTVPQTEAVSLASMAQCLFRENEGISLILARQLADSLRLPYEGAWRMITLEVHSSLQAVGFLAAWTAELAASGISTNVVSAFHHDHVFVQAHLAEQAMQVLLRVQNRYAAGAQR